ncbi:NADH-ubiquinone oxidoreductase chain 2 [Platanthera zijinensis]|uniref:NADH-ubiquinone oxidoreductase chain 2 n=1 Tax=Platanthera zijinensis TaxID=2320716 RepID=A0AAP0FWS0_9ASPA
MWAPDIYEGSPTPVTTFLSIVPKISLFANMSRVFLVGSYGGTLQKSLLFQQHCFYDLRSTGHHGLNESKKTSSL